MKKGCLIVLIIFVALIIGVAAVVMPYIIEFNDKTSEDGEKVVVVIPQGATSADIAQILKDKGLIRSTEIFQIKAKLSSNGGKMNYGTFDNLHKGMCIPDIINALASGVNYRKTVTFAVPEGFSVEQIAARAENLGFCTKDEFLSALNDEYDYAFVKEIPASEGARYKLQGYLHPKTYEFYSDATAHEIIDKMLAQFEKEMKAVEIASGRSIHETVIIASLLEREALLDSDLPKIAGVIYNRIDKGMRLQIDATIQYVKSDGTFEYEVTKADYSDFESPYSTYKVDALPIGPICNPGMAAIKAANQPEVHEYLYYHTDKTKNDGSHIFTKTYKEHLATQ